MPRTRRRDEELDEAQAAGAERSGAGRSDAPVPAVVALGRLAGNRAVSGLLQREGSWIPNIMQGGGTSAVTPPPIYLNVPPTSKLAGEPAQGLTPDVAAAIRRYLEGRRYEIGNKVADGAISMPELVQAIRETVPGAASAPVDQIEKVVRDTMGSTTPPPARRKRTAQGAGQELAARIANALPSAPRLRVDFSGNSVALTMQGLVASTTVGGAKVTATGTPGGGEVTAEKGGASVTASGSADAFGLTAKVERAAFEAKIEKDEKTGAWSKWEVGLRVSVTGGEPLEPVPDIPELRETAVKAEKAIRGIVSHLQAGGKPDDARVKELMKEVKPAIEGVTRAVETPAGPRVTVGGSVKGGDDKLGTVAGLSLIVEF
ncbi:MAG TPA: hypothetical protein VFG74_15020 [Miltoncostaeaceae bacterium]|jgi:hypothetical protein|nr:hypothetical protein [Miltoncostaeaceae bacterium]